MEHIKPLLKWAGGKYKLIDKITNLFPQQHSGRYIEPFVGAGAVALNVQGFKKISVNDINLDLTNVWWNIQTFPQELITECINLFKFNNETDYYKLRDEFNNYSGFDVRRSALFIYLNKHGFNGLCRYNKNGSFNVPFGKYKSVNFDPERIWTLNKNINKWGITHVHYSHLMLTTGNGDVVYCDPPYVSDEKVKNGFTAYSQNGFSLEDQEHLAFAARGSCDRGATVIISNHNTPFTRELYTNLGAELINLQVQRNISCKGNSRTKAEELLAVFRPKQFA